MDSFSDLFKKENQGQVILCVLFIVYLIMGYKTPSSLATLIDNIYGKITSYNNSLYGSFK